MKKNKKIILLALLVLLVLLFTGCNSKQYIVTLEYNNGEEREELVFNKNSQLIINSDIDYEGYELVGWFLDEELTLPLEEDYKIKSNIVVFAKWEIAKYDVCFYNGNELYNKQEVIHNDTIKYINDPEKQGYKFIGWYNESDNKLFSFKTVITKDINLYAKYEVVRFEVLCDKNDYLYKTKEDLYVSYFTDFYMFLLEKTDIDFEKYKINDLNEFLEICLTWDAYNSNSFYGIGNSFSKYYLTIEVGGKLEDQPDTTFIGYCYQNNMYEEFIPFLMTFFAYWRTDEGYTGSSSDPNNTGNDFFASAWASLVDTCKFFYFTGDNLNDTYPWFKSERVKDALDNIPGVGSNIVFLYGDIENPIILPNLQREGYIFLGWYDEFGNKVETVYSEMNVVAKWEKINS